LFARHEVLDFVAMWEVKVRPHRQRQFAENVDGLGDDVFAVDGGMGASVDFFSR